MSLHVATVVGARPEFVQVGAITREVARRSESQILEPIRHDLIHTGQHYDADMSADFFRDLRLPNPTNHLGVGSASPATQLGEMISRLDPILRSLVPDVVMVFGDTNSTLAGALAAAKLGIPVAHVESGLRSFNLLMPEELNRRTTDHLASVLFCPSANAVSNLESEGITKGIYVSGDVMWEALQHDFPTADAELGILESYGLTVRGYAVATVHRAENTDDPERLNEIHRGLIAVAGEMPVVFPVHPRTRNRLDHEVVASGIQLTDPVSHLSMVALVKNAAVLLTDSGGLQKEAYWLGTPCVTMRDETEWIETVAMGWNKLCGADSRRIPAATSIMAAGIHDDRPPLYGEGTGVSSLILNTLVAHIREEGRGV